MSAFSTISSFIFIKYSYRLPMIAGTLAVSLSMVLMGLGFHSVVIGNFALANVVTLGIFTGMAGMAMGTMMPPTANSAMDLAPEKVAAIAGLQGMFRTTGGVVGSAVIILIVSHFQNEGAALGGVFIGMGVVFLVTIPVMFMIPDSARMRRIKGKAPPTAVANTTPQPAAGAE